MYQQSTVNNLHLKVNEFSYDKIFISTIKQNSFL